MPLVRQSVRHASCSIAGRRAINEDRAATLAVGGDRYVAVIADGMGGVRAGDVASDAAMKAFILSVRSANGSEEREMLQTAFAAADAAIRDASTPERKGMGSTLVAAIIRDGEIWIGNIGDSRAVLVTSGDVVPLSTDHSVVGEALRNGQISEVEALRHPERHVISRAIGEGDAQPDMRFHSLDRDDSGAGLLLLGSDGLFNFVGDTEILELTEDAGTAREVAEGVVRRAVDNGSDDNVSAAVIMFRPRRRRSVWAAAVAIAAALVLSGGAYVRYGATVSSFVDSLARRQLLPRWNERPAPNSRLVTVPVEGAVHLRVGMSGSLCAAKGDCVGSWRVVAANRTSAVLEIRLHAVGSPRAKS